jgi:hypothetical protein
LRISGRLEDLQQIAGFPADRVISGRLKEFGRLEDLQQIGVYIRPLGGFPAVLKIFGRFENIWQVGGSPADWRIIGRCENVWLI